MTAYDGYVFVDTETGGLDPLKHPILEIAAIRTDLDFRIREYWRSYIKPHSTLLCTPEALEITGINLDDLANEPNEADVADTFKQFLSGRGNLRFAGFNCKYDLGMLEAMKERAGIEMWGFYTPWLCLLEEAREKLPNLPKVWNERWKKNQTHTLELVCKHLGIDISGAHGAAFDIYATVQVARKLMR